MEEEEHDGEGAAPGVQLQHGALDGALVRGLLCGQVREEGAEVEGASGLPSRDAYERRVTLRCLMGLRRA